MPFLERLIYLLLVPELFSRIFFEVLLGRANVTLTQERQYVFYLFLLADYVISLIRKRRLGVDPSRFTLPFYLLTVMCLQGIFVGFAWSNHLSVIAVHTINVLILIVNIYLCRSPGASRLFEFDRVLALTTFYCVLMVIFSIGGHAIGRRMDITLGSAAPSAIAMVVLMVALVDFRKGYLFFVLAISICVFLTLSDWNRTTLLFIGSAGFVVIARHLLKNTVVLTIVAIVAVVAAASSPTLLPPDSPLGQRIDALQNVDLSARDGSIGERQSEADAVHEKIDNMGQVGRVFGAGHGAVYDVMHTGVWLEDYGNAHYSWILFYLRYGEIGYVYLGILALYLSGIFVRNVFRPDAVSIFIGFLALYNVLYLGTYGYFTFFIAGLDLAKGLFAVPAFVRTRIEWHQRSPSATLLGVASRAELDNLP